MSDLPQTFCACAVQYVTLHKKFKVNHTKIKGGCQSGRKVLPHNSKDHLPLEFPKKIVKWPNVRIRNKIQLFCRRSFVEWMFIMHYLFYYCVGHRKQDWNAFGPQCEIISPNLGNWGSAMPVLLIYHFITTKSEEMF